ncbi:hypothetical protein BJY24_006433 [Nocardia transvalensis]|uniref:Uncharacterized protein n=1 Tax=Nocardia transvalensis TaxID=37333 RepID=A0A7W9ULF9_9NOCA|nr:hypothetical protein [Nocardia transvalensis]MBB5917521.1 hypothetical protein [Nocardia transvalensis]
MTGTLALDHLEQSLRIPVVDGMHAQGDLIVIPLRMLESVAPHAEAVWRHVPPEGIEVLRGAAGGNPHTLVAEPGRCRWTTRVVDPEGLALGMFTTETVAYLMHPEHGATGSSPGTYLIRRQREYVGTRAYLVAD